MIGFFFASMVALTMTASTTSNSILLPVYFQPVYNEDNVLDSYFYDSNQEDEPIANTRSGIEMKNRYFSINIPNFDSIQFKTVVDYGSLAGSTTESYIGISVEPVGESVSTNLYLDNFVFYILSNGNEYTYSSGWKMEFKGQSLYWDNYDGAYQVDLPMPYSLTDYSVYVSFYIKCTDHTLMEGQWYNNGYNDGYSTGNLVGEENGYNNGYNTGYTDGYNQGFSTDSTVTSIFSGILQVALVPINFFLAIFNFEILGINLSGFIRALFTVAITIIIIRTIFGGKGASDS